MLDQRGKIVSHTFQGEYIQKELEALYSLKKYRTLKNRYYSDDDPSAREREIKKYLDNVK